MFNKHGQVFNENIYAMLPVASKPRVLGWLLAPFFGKRQGSECGMTLKVFPCRQMSVTG